ncbi:hypothetical protein AB4K08_00830 [Serratia fonticola]|uniref:hypothetical protein n=1 Tax=Serratia fonticola TaxID=47917 RepID=UPI0034C60310
MSKQYDERNAMALGDYHGRHVHAMTVESLHTKSDIAAELGYRDKRIDELLAALEEKDQRIKELSSALTIEKGASAFDSRRTAHIDRMRDKFLKRAEAAEQREGHLKADAAVLGQRIAELEQRLQQPIKLPKSEIGMACEFVSDHIVVSLAAVLVEAATAGFKAEVEGE